MSTHQLIIGIDAGGTCGLSWNNYKAPYLVCAGDLIMLSPAHESVFSMVVSITDIAAKLRMIRDNHPGTKPLVVVEKLKTKWRGAREHLVNANNVIKAVKATWPRKHDLVIVEPKTWQGDVLAGLPGADTKARSLLSANNLKTAKKKIIDHNEADAVNLQFWGTRQRKGIAK